MPRASLEQLTAFVAVAEHGSFSAAARAIKKDRATLHHQVGDLETDWAVTLFEREGRKPQLTDTGAMLLTQAKHILYQMSALELACDNLSDSNPTRLTVCHDMSVPCDAIAHFERSLHQDFPQTSINWLHTSRDKAVKAILEGEAQFAITINQNRPFPRDGMSFINLGYPRFAFYAHKDSPLAQKEEVTLTDLAEHRHYIAENTAESWMAQQLDFSPYTSTVSNIDVLLALLKNGGYALLPSHLFFSEAYQGQFRRLDVEFLNRDGRASYVLLAPTFQGQSKLHDRFAEIVREWFKPLG